MTPEKRLEFKTQSYAHYDADILVKGTYGEDYEGIFKGCSIGCHVHYIYPDLAAHEVENMTNVHKTVADYYGFPKWMPHLQDNIFEDLPEAENTLWHKQFADVVFKHSDDFDWELAKYRVLSAILKVAHKNAGTSKKVVQDVIELCDRAAQGIPVSDQEWKKAERVAARAARTAARAAARTAARAAAWAAAGTAARTAARTAAGTAAGTAEWTAAGTAAFQQIRDGVLKALEEPTS